jgi:DNA-binding SARP family transcriptional activator
MLGFLESDAPVLICLLGKFRLFKAGRPVALRGGGKTEELLSALALRLKTGLRRESLLATLWPDRNGSVAGQSLNTLVYSLRRLLGNGIGGSALVLYVNGWYRLNSEAGVVVDMALFEDLVNEGDRRQRAGDGAAAARQYERALAVYSGELVADADLSALIERERLRNMHLTVLARLADRHFADADYPACLENALRLLACDPCREDAHRLVMRCRVRLGERAQALRQYRLCEDILRLEFGAVPEPATTAMFEAVRLDPSSV